MLISAILLSLVKTYLTFDFPIPFERPEVAFQPKRLSKYYDLSSSSWRNSDVSLKQTYSQMLTFCQDMYPDRDVVRLHQGPPRTLQFCKIKDSSKCSQFDSVTWICVSRDEFNTETHTASMASTASRPEARCLNETIERVSYETCTSIETAIYSCSENTSFNKMDNVKTCNITIDGRETNGLLSAEMRCCSKEDTAADTTDAIPRQPGHNNNNNPFIPWTFGPNRTINPVDPDLPPEWCGLEQVEAQRGNITDAKMEIMKEIYTKNDNSEGGINYDALVAQIEQVERDLNLEVVSLYQNHFTCLSSKVAELVQSAYLLSDSVPAVRARDNFKTDITAVNSSLTEVSLKFAEICTDMVGGESNDFNKDYREVVTELQILRMKIENISYKVEHWKDTDCVHCPPTTSHTDYNTLPPVLPPDTGDTPDLDQDKKEDENDTKLKNQKYLIAIVSTVSVITIIVALVFFIVVVRRTLHKDVTGRFTTLPSADILTNEQYVAFLQKNGYANPTCRLPQKYLDDHD